MASPKRITKKQRKGQVLHVRSHSAVKAFESTLGKGPLTLVYINAKWCGACHRFNDEVWSHLTKLKNKSVNLASVDSEMIGKTSLANVPRKFYPTLMLVGKDKKPATFEDEEGNPTNAMPRNSTLSEDREALSNLVKNPTVKNKTVDSTMGSTVGSTVGSTMGSSLDNTLGKTLGNTLGSTAGSTLGSTMARTVGRTVGNTLSSTMGSTMGSTMPSTMGSTMGRTDNKASLKNSMNNITRSNSQPRANVTKKSLASSPFESLDTMPELGTANKSLLQKSITENEPALRTVLTMNMNSNSKRMGSTPSKQIAASSPPDIGSDLVSSQTKSSSPTSLVSEPPKSGGMLLAIKHKTAQLKSMLNLRNSTRKRK